MMDAQLLKTLGQIAGIGGIAIGAFLIIGRNVLAKNIFPRLQKRDATKVILSIAFMAWTIALAGIGAYVSVHEVSKADQNPPGTVDIDIGVPAQSHSQPGPVVRNGLSRPMEVRYSVSREGGVPHISPISPYLDAIKTGTTVSMVGWAPGGTPYFAWEYPRLSVKVRNSTSAPCYITEAAIEVVSSDIDMDPVLVAEGGFSGYVGIANEGWGKVVNPKATLQLSDRRGGFIKRHVMLTDHLSLDFPQCLSETELEMARQLGESRPFKASISYETENGVQKKFDCEGITNFGPPPMPFVPPSREPYDVFLPAGKEGYETIVPMSQVTPTGGIDNFEIRIGTDKSATFDLRIEFRTTSGEVIGKTSVSLSTFIARTGKIPGTVPTTKWRGIGESVVCAGMRLTLSNVRLLEKSEFDQVFLALVEVRNEGSKAVWFPAGEDAAGDEPFLQITGVSLEVNDESGGYRPREHSAEVKEQAALLKAGDSASVEFEFEKPWGDIKDILISMQLRGKRVIDEVAFQVPIGSINGK